MKNKDIEAHVNRHGTKMSKEKLIEMIKKTTIKDVSFSRDETTNKLIVCVPL